MKKRIVLFPFPHFFPNNRKNILRLPNYNTVATIDDIDDATIDKYLCRGTRNKYRYNSFDDLIPLSRISLQSTSLSSIPPSSSSSLFFSLSKRSTHFSFHFSFRRNFFSNSLFRRQRLVSTASIGNLLLLSHSTDRSRFHEVWGCDLIDSFALIEQQPDKRRNRTSSTDLLTTVCIV